MFIVGGMTFWPEYQYLHPQRNVKWFKMTRSTASGSHSSQPNPYHIDKWLQCYLNMYVLDKIGNPGLTGWGLVRTPRRRGWAWYEMNTIMLEKE